jgi:hypothetical protein
MTPRTTSSLCKPSACRGYQGDRRGNLWSPAAGPPAQFDRSAAGGRARNCRVSRKLGSSDGVGLATQRERRFRAMTLATNRRVSRNGPRLRTDAGPWYQAASAAR